MIVRLTIHGQVVSKANSRQLVRMGQRIVPIKSEKALQFERDAAKQVRALYPMLQGPLKVTLRIFYPDERRDLDESLVLDVLQDRVYRNDRQVREKHVYHAIDKRDPRVEIEVETMTAQQQEIHPHAMFDPLGDGLRSGELGADL